jgi:hypothetical protein
VTPPDHLVPGARLAADQAGAAQIDRILARRRSELARLGLAARSALRHRDTAVAHLVDHRDGYEGGDAPGDLLAVVDSMIERAVRACDEALTDARRAADETVARAIDEGHGELRHAGLDASHLPAAPRPRLEHHVVPPPSAGELWRRVGAGRLATPADPVPADPDRGRTVPQRHGAHPSGPSMWAPLDVAVSVPASSLPSPDSFTDLRPAAVVTLVANEAGAEEQTDDERSAAAFDTFWQEAGRDRRARGRFLRRGAKEDS